MAHFAAAAVDGGALSSSPLSPVRAPAMLSVRTRLYATYCYCRSIHLVPAAYERVNPKPARARASGRAHRENPCSQGKRRAHSLGAPCSRPSSNAPKKLSTLASTPRCRAAPTDDRKRGEQHCSRRVPGSPRDDIDISLAFDGHGTPPNIDASRRSRGRAAADGRRACPPESIDAHRRSAQAARLYSRRCAAGVVRVDVQCSAQPGGADRPARPQGDAQST